MNALVLSLFRRYSVPVALASLLVSGFAAAVEAAPGDSREAGTEEELVKEALHREIYGLTAEREQLLQNALRQNGDCARAQWQRGYVRSGADWIDVDRLMYEPDSAAMTRYRLKRNNLPDTVAGQLAMANWCRDNELAAQEQAHLFRVLDLDPDHVVARQRLGYQMADGAWWTIAELAAAQARRGKEAAAARKWRSELLEIQRDLTHDSSQRRAVARSRLAGIQDAHALPAMESLVSVSSEHGAMAVIDTVKDRQGREAVESLIRHAVLSQWPLPRGAAAEALGQRRREAYVPAMVQQMYAPLVSQFGVSQLPNGALGYRHVFVREGIEERQVLLLDTEYRRVPRAGGDGEETLFLAFADSLAGMMQLEQAAARQNFAQGQLNQRLGEALNIATQQQLPPDPDQWWQWWDQENDLVRLGDKQTRARQQVRQVSMVDLPSLSMTGSGQTFPGRQAECFAAGTMVWTRRGQQRIETLRVGDLVLSQNVETGELGWKPVLRTTVRPAGELTKIVIGRDELQTSAGHLYWVAGHGWAKASRLESGMLLHCLRGSLLVSTVEKGGHAETYNLVVADHHTYFVGSERVLSHDVTLKRPTEAVVPGLVPE